MTNKTDGGTQDVKAALEDVFKGCSAKHTTALGSYHVELSFHEYEIRIILDGRVDRTWDYNFRFMQRVKGPGRKPVKFIINEVHTRDPVELLRAIRGAKEYLLGIVHCINCALKRKPVPQISDIEDLLLGSD